MTIVLGIDTSSTELGVGLYRDDRALASYSRFIRNSHAEHLTQAMTMLLDGSGITPGDITHIAIAAGPGSFTGLRIGCAFIKGFCAPGGVKALSLSSLYILAHGAKRNVGSVVAAIDARRDDVFCARFHCTKGALVRKTDDALVQASVFRESLESGDTVVTDTLGYARSTVFGFLDGRDGVFPVERHPFGRGLVCAAEGAAALSRPDCWKDPVDVLPAYLREFTSPSATVERVP
jgi:tRNA threonylcarbamoyladenosine biosynthesis protein TsaB